MIIDFENPGLVVLQATPLNRDGTVKAALSVASVRVYHVAAGVEVIDLASTPLVHVPTSSVWRYLWEPVTLAVGEYTAEFSMTDTDGLSTVALEDVIIRNVADVSALALEATSQTILANTGTDLHASMQDTGTTATFSVWQELNGEPRTDLDGMTAKVLDSLGAVLNDLGAGTVGASGVFRWTMASGSLIKLTNYVLLVTATKGVSTWIFNRGFAKVG